MRRCSGVCPIPEDTRLATKATGHPLRLLCGASQSTGNIAYDRGVWRAPSYMLCMHAWYCLDVVIE